MASTPRQRITFVALALVLSACGSTVQMTGSQGLGESALGSTSGGTGAGPSASGSPVGGTGGLGTGGSSATTPGNTGGGARTPNAGGTGGSGLGSTSGAVGSALRNGPGVTDKTITLGMTYNQNASAANSALGASNISTPNAVASSRVIINDINAHGGIAGRKVNILYLPMDPNTNQTYSSMGEQVCSYFTQDHKVLAVIDAAPFADARACLEKHGVIHLGGSLINNELYPHDIAVYSSSLSRVFTALVPGLARQGWFAGWNRLTGAPGPGPAKTGIVTIENAYHRRVVDGILIPGLRALGHAPDPADVIRITPPGGFSDDGAVVAAIDNAVLKLNADGVTHVILDDSNGSLALFFNNYAYSQHYFPRYGGSSGNGWQTLLGAKSIQAQTLVGAIGIGWQPLVDLPYESGDGPSSNATRHRCFALFKKNGMAPTDQGTSLALAEGCDVFYLLPSALTGYRGPVNADVVLEHVNALGIRYELASGLGSRLAADQHDGAGGFSDMHFDSGCSCMTYSGPRHAMPR